MWSSDSGAKKAVMKFTHAHKVCKSSLQAGGVGWWEGRGRGGEGAIASVARLATWPVNISAQSCNAKSTACSNLWNASSGMLCTDTRIKTIGKSSSRLRVAETQLRLCVQVLLSNKSQQRRTQYPYWDSTMSCWDIHWSQVNRQCDEVLREDSPWFLCLTQVSDLSKASSAVENGYVLRLPSK